MEDKVKEEEFEDQESGDVEDEEEEEGSGAVEPKIASGDESAAEEPVTDSIEDKSTTETIDTTLSEIEGSGNDTLDMKGNNSFVFDEYEEENDSFSMDGNATALMEGNETALSGGNETALMDDYVEGNETVMGKGNGTIIVNETDESEETRRRRKVRKFFHSICQSLSSCKILNRNLITNGHFHVSQRDVSEAGEDGAEEVPEEAPEEVTEENIEEGSGNDTVKVLVVGEASIVQIKEEAEKNMTESSGEIMDEEGSGEDEVEEESSTLFDEAKILEKFDGFNETEEEEGSGEMEEETTTLEDMKEESTTPLGEIDIEDGEAEVTTETAAAPESPLGKSWVQSLFNKLQHENHYN